MLSRTRERIFINRRNQSCQPLGAGDDFSRWISPLGYTQKLPSNTSEHHGPARDVDCAGLDVLSCLIPWKSLATESLLHLVAYLHPICFSSVEKQEISRGKFKSSMGYVTVCASKLLHSLETLQPTEATAAQLDTFRLKGLRKIIEHVDNVD